MYLYIVTYIPIAKKRLGKHILRKLTLAKLGGPMRGNGSVNKQQYRGCVFYVVRSEEL
jgi:hypothetical protein